MHTVDHCFRPERLALHCCAASVSHAAGASTCCQHLLPAKYNLRRKGRRAANETVKFSKRSGLGSRHENEERTEMGVSLGGPLFIGRCTSAVTCIEAWQAVLWAEGYTLEGAAGGGHGEAGKGRRCGAQVARQCQLDDEQVGTGQLANEHQAQGQRHRGWAQAFRRRPSLKAHRRVCAVLRWQGGQACMEQCCSAGPWREWRERVGARVSPALPCPGPCPMPPCPPPSAPPTRSHVGTPYVSADRLWPCTDNVGGTAKQNKETQGYAAGTHGRGCVLVFKTPAGGQAGEAR